MAFAHSRTAVLCLLLTSGGCAPADEVQADGIAELDGLGARNLVFLHVDTLRSDHTPWYGSARNTMPRLSSRDWMVVDGYVASSSWTASSSASVLTGARLDQHQVLWSVMSDSDLGSGDVNRSLDLPTLATELGAAGYATALFSGNSFVGERSGLDRGFEDYREYLESSSRSNAMDLVYEAEDWLAGQSAEQPFFLMLQPMDPHMPYSPAPEDYGTWSDTTMPLVAPTLSDHEQEDRYRALIQDPATREEARTEIQNLYDEQILGLDRAIDELLLALEDSGRLEDTLVVFASDHGESLGELEYEDFGHGKTYRPTVLRVPLMFHAPGLDAERVPCLSSSTDLAPTLMRALGVGGLDQLDGAPLQMGCRDAVYSSFYLPQGMGFASATSGDKMLIASCGDGEIAAYDLRADGLGRVTMSSKNLPALMGVLTTGLSEAAVQSEVNGCATLLE